MYVFGQENLSILSSFDTLPTSPIKKQYCPYQLGNKFPKETISNI